MPDIEELERLKEHVVLVVCEGKPGGCGENMILARIIIPRLSDNTEINVWYLFFGLFLFEEGFLIPMLWFLYQWLGL